MSRGLRPIRAWLTVAAACLACAGPVLAADVVEYYHTDAIGNVRAVANQAGQVIERHDYLPFGEECTTGVCASNLPGTNTRKFTGKERDKETGLDYFGARYYSARTARFTTVDPVYTWQENLVDPQRWNRYAYARNNPLRYVDPDGKFPVDTIWDVGNVLYDIYTGVKTGNWTDLGADALAAAIPYVPAGASKLRLLNKLDDAVDAAKARIGANKAAGDAFEEVVVAQKKAEQTGVVQQLTVRTESGVRTRLDIAGRDASGNVRLTEAKSSATARLTPNQKKGFPEIGATGGTVAGRGKPGFAGGTQIPPTKVEVCRPPCK